MQLLISLRINGVFRLCPSSGILKTRKRFGNWICFRPPVSVIQHRKNSLESTFNKVNFFIKFKTTRELHKDILAFRPNVIVTGSRHFKCT
jgi:hypothetical protein